MPTGGAVRKTRPLPFCALCRYAVEEPDEALGADISLVLPPRLDGHKVFADFPDKVGPVRAGVADILLAQRHGVLDVHPVGVGAPRRLVDHHLASNATGAVECGQRGPDLLSCIIIRLSMYIYKSRRIL